MERVYASWPTAIATILIALVAGVIVWWKAPGTPESYLTIVLLLLASLWVVLSAAGKIPLYRLR